MRNEKENKQVIKSRVKKAAEKMIRGKENEIGITLIALVITVIIMLILAGVAISALTGDGGLFEKTQGAADKYSQAAQNEADQIASLMNEINEYLSGVPQQPAEPTDKEAPNEFNLSVTATATSITVTGETTDVGTSGIKGYQFILKNSDATVIITNWTAIQTETSYTFTKEIDGIEEGTTYKVSMKALDNAGNEREATNKDESITTNLSASMTLSVGDYINYSYNDYSKWRVLSNDNTILLISEECPENYTFQGSYLSGLETALNEIASRYVNPLYATSGDVLSKSFCNQNPDNILYGCSTEYWCLDGTNFVHIMRTNGTLSMGMKSIESSTTLGVRVVIVLKPNISLEPNVGDGTAENPWRIAEN